MTTALLSQPAFPPPSMPGREFRSLDEKIPLHHSSSEVICSKPVGSLRPHPLLSKYAGPVDLREVGALALQNESALDRPLIITVDDEIIEGLDRWEHANHRGLAKLTCKILQLTYEETVIWILSKHQPFAGLNPFTRVLIALELEPWLKARAKANQQHGGEWKHLSKLAEASHIDVRQQLAKISGVGAANVDKVRLIWAKADATVVDALKTNEISIHRAWRWSHRSNDGSRMLLWEHRRARQMQTILRLQSKKLRRSQSSSLDGLNQIRGGLRQLMQHQGNGMEIASQVVQLLSTLGDGQYDSSCTTIAA